MKVPAKHHYQNTFKLNFLNIGFFWYLTHLFAYALPAQPRSAKLSIPYQISQTTRSREIDYSRLEIGGVKLSMSEAEVKKVLGQPLGIKDGYMAIAGKTRTLRYSGITIELLEDVKPTGNFFVYEIKADSSRYVTKDGVKVGDSVSKVMSIYGRPESSENDGANTLSYPVNHPSPAYLIFTIENARVKTITCGDFLG